MAVPRQGARVVIYVVLTAQMLPEEFAECPGYDLYGPHHVNRAWASPLRRTHVVCCVVYTAQIALRAEKVYNWPITTNATCAVHTTQMEQRAHGKHTFCKTWGAICVVHTAQIAFRDFCWKAGQAKK